MAFCKNCGAQIDDNATVCPSCGKAVNEPAAAVNNGTVNGAVTSQDKVMGVLAYIGILFLIPLFAAKDSKFARYHTNQGLVLFLASLLGGVMGALGGIPFVGIVFGILGGVIGLIAFVFMILGIVNVVQGKLAPLPFIGNIQILK